MDQNRETLTPPASREELARLLDHALVRPDLTEAQVIEGCQMAARNRIAAVSVRPCDIDTAVREMQGAGVAVGSVSGFPHGSTTTAAKLYETRDLLRRGAKEIDMVINISKLLSRQFQFVETELVQMAEACHKEGALLKVILEVSVLPDELKMVACRLCGRAGADFVKTSTGFAPGQWTAADLKLLRQHSPAAVKIKASGGIRTLEQVIAAFEAGCARIGTTATEAILKQWDATHAAAAPVS